VDDLSGRLPAGPVSALAPTSQQAGGRHGTGNASTAPGGEPAGSVQGTVPVLDVIEFDRFFAER
jgi:hypothetical protein